jgi:hypothetical protein
MHRPQVTRGTARYFGSPHPKRLYPKLFKPLALTNHHYLPIVTKTSAATEATETMPSKTQSESDINPSALQAKYIAEREKRAQNGGDEQYRLSKPQDLKGYLTDPYATPGFSREPVKATYDIVIIGGGYTGVQTAARLVANDHNNICLIEKGSDVGGTW